MFFANAKEENQRKQVVSNLVTESKTTGGYYFLLGISAIIASLGLLTNNSTAILGAMLITPLLTPILALGLGVTTLSGEAIFRSSIGIINSIATIVFISFIIGLSTSSDHYRTPEVLLKGSYSVAYLVIAFFSGLGATYAWIEHKISSALTGVAVAVSLLPPLSVTGISIAQADYILFIGSLRVFSANFVGIVMASTLMFTIFNFTKLKGFEERKIKYEE
ncbi:DUF389 domain-containing protein [Patescibacteria group bacterium]|nr:DUF389 domain-containing protein [Patescibacteria group bacterium]